MSADSTFLQIETAAHGGAFGHNPIPLPTEAQCRAGNYKMGRVSLHGLTIAIEQPRGSYRTGIDPKTGKRWASRMAAHYGYINGTTGNDGDCVDCFVGHYPQSELAFVINQNVGGRFDEHKTMLCFPDEESARRAYLDSYERGWNGLESIVPVSIAQLKWWLKNGDMCRPLRADNLPDQGFETMTRKVQWSSDALPYDTTLDHVLYAIRCADAGEGLLMDAVSVHDVVEDADGVLTLDALVSPYVKLERKMEVLRGIMERTGGAVKPVAMQITEPFKQRGVANVAVIFELSDGQTVSIYFHNPDVTPAKMASTDEVISWKWLLNKKDITIVVAPERGADLNVREVARRIMRLAEKNSPAFQRINAKRAERMQSIQGLKDEITSLETELAAAQRELEVAKVNAEDAKSALANSDKAEANQGAAAPETALAAEMPSVRAPVIVTGKEIGEFPNTEDGHKALRAAARTMFEAMLGQWVPCPALSGDVELRKSGMKKMLSLSADPRKLKLIAALKELIGNGTKVGTKHAYDLPETANVVAYHTLRASAELDGKTLMVRFIIKEDDKGKFHWDHTVHASDVAFDSTKENGPTKVDPRSATTYKSGASSASTSGWLVADPTLRREIPEGMLDSVNAGLELFNLVIEGEELEVVSEEDEANFQAEQSLIETYVQSFGAAAAALNAAVSALNMDAVQDNAGAAVEINKLREAANLAQRDIIGKASADLEAAGLKTWDERLSGLHDTQGFGAWSHALDAYQAAINAIQATAKEKLIEAGKAELAALPADAPLADVARAVFRKNGIDMGQRGEGWIARVVHDIEAKNADGLRDILAGVGSDSNKASMEIFERATGVKLAKTQRERGRQIDEWAGITPEKHAEIETAKDAAWLARERERKVKGAWDALKAMNVQDGNGTAVDGQQYLLGKFAAGYNEVGTSKKGAATIYGLRNGANLSFVNSRTFNAFLKAAAAFGGLRQALELVGAAEPGAGNGDTDKIAAVDAAYKFESATDGFKLWLHESLGKPNYSPFVTAKAMDEAAKRHGAVVEWDKALAALDDVGHAVASLEASLSVVENNAPINRADGDVAQAQLEVDTAASIREAIATLTEADYGPSEADIGGTFEAECLVLDGVGGAYTNADKQAISATKALLQYFRDFLASDAKFAKVPTAIYGWTAEGQVMDKDEAKARLRKLIDVAINRKAGISDLTPKQDQRLADFAHDARIISDYLTKRIRHTGARNLLRTPEMKAKYPHIDNQPAEGLDSVALDGVDGDGYVGKINKEGKVVGRIDIADDGKAMVYVGTSGDERVVFASGVRAMYSDDDVVLMVDALFSMRAATAPAPTIISYANNDPDMPGIYKRDAGYLALKYAASELGVAAQDAEVDANLVIITSITYGGQSLKIEISPHGWVNVGSAQVMIDTNVTTASTAADGKAIAEAVKAQAGAAIAPVEAEAAKRGAGEGQADPQKDADRALFQSVIDGTVPDILAPELADSLEAAFMRNQDAPELVALFERAVAAYQNAMMAATASLA